MGKIENAVLYMLEIANNPANGYDQTNRWGADYDCSSLIISCLEKAGIKVKSAGATYTGNMEEVFLKCGFVKVAISKRQRGDILLQHDKKTGKGHTAAVVDFNTIVHASINEKGTTTGGKTGDQTGKEICTRPYYSRPWDCCLHYAGDDSAAVVVQPVTYNALIKARILKKGMEGADVLALQFLLNGKFGEALETDGKYGQMTHNAVIKYQRNHFDIDGAPLLVDGEAGSKTLTALFNN